MNNFFIMFACRCFTDIDKLIKNQGTQDPRKVAKFMLQIEAKKTQWESSTIGQFEKQGGKYTSYINSSLGLKGQDTMNSGDMKKTESTHSSKDKNNLS